jgi:chaperonin GroEL
MDKAKSFTAKVTRIALEKASSLSGMLLTTEYVITELKKDELVIPMGGRMPEMM